MFSPFLFLPTVPSTNFDFSVFSVAWGICFSLKAKPNGSKTSDLCTLLTYGTRLPVGTADNSKMKENNAIEIDANYSAALAARVSTTAMFSSNTSGMPCLPCR
jgi:hypothetical protein